MIFARKRDNYLENIVNFSVLNEEFEDEYSGEFKVKNKGHEASIRTLLYFRKARQILHRSWKITKEGNKAIVFRKAL